MPSAPHLGMGRFSISTPTLSRAANSNSTAAPSLPSPVNPDDTTSSSTASRPSFLSRLSLPLSLPLRSRHRNVADFHIRPDEPYRKYNAGEHVRGAVILVVVKPVRITHLVVSLNGYVRVCKEPAASAKAQNALTLPHGSSTQPRYHGNGFATLFGDEQVLSGDGRIEPGKYEFGFDLVFPEKGLPSSIDFERGTISYTITATLTRPTTILPTSNCDRKVTLVETVDIGFIPPPRPRTIFLEPISKRTRRKKSMGLDKASVAVAETNEIASEADSSDPPASTEDREPPTDQRSPIPSDVRSDVSGESALSGSTGRSRTELSLAQVGTLTSSAKQQAVDDKTITATIELLKGGCLPGDQVPVRVTVHHIKRIKSMNGVIVTLYRQGKVDVAPPEDMFVDTANQGNRGRVENEESYPRSRTGLGGLSLSSSGSTSVFRKDLDQNISPLIIDPGTLKTIVTVSVKMPDDSFPTIKGVPGGMISFKYLVEVVVDLGGRLANQFQGGQGSRFGSNNHGTWDATTNTYSNTRRGANMADTTQLRREKGVISVSIETVVGTVDTSRKKTRVVVSPSSQRRRFTESDEDESIRPDLSYMDEIPRDPYPTKEVQTPQGYFPPPVNGTHAHPHSYTSHPYTPLAIPSSSSRPAHSSPVSQTLQLSQNSHFPESPRPDYSSANHFTEAAPEYIPPPQIPDQSRLSEKERVRQAETRLLPSQPPAGPSSPPNNDDIYDAEEAPQPPSTQVEPPDVAGDGPSAPGLDDLSAPGGPPANPLEDKQELERQRLMNEASAPPEFPEDSQQRNGGPSTQPSAPELEPSAPDVDDVEGFSNLGPRDGPSGSAAYSEDREQLPAYQR